MASSRGSQPCRLSMPFLFSSCSSCCVLAFLARSAWLRGRRRALCILPEFVRHQAPRRREAWRWSVGSGFETAAAKRRTDAAYCT
ncbi:hypothetical protein PF008_g18502 [Phytophthora fragariae]|uniref:Uncharacterized protein n=1 Tax=Phytophthora fragariae TaxID=53985 RepID=A0A6G0R5E6_9STRA|nr:hypothetical protein PF008_g18502 [Phytophthora fragariae]